MKRQVQKEKRSPNAGKTGIKEEDINIIKNTLLGYDFKSEYYIQVAKNNFFISLFIVLYDSQKLKTKRLTTLLSKLKKEDRQEFQKCYFSKHDPDEINLPLLVQKLSQQFNYHGSLIENNAVYFTEQPIYSLLEQELYKNKLRVNYYRNNKLEPFIKNSPFKEKNKDNKHDLVIIEQKNSYFLAFYSTKPAFDRPERPSAQKQKPKLQPKNQEKKQVKSNVNKQLKQSKAQIKQLNERPQQQVKQQPEDKEDTKIEKITFFVLLLFLIICLYELISSSSSFNFNFVSQTFSNIIRET